MPSIAEYAEFTDALRERRARLLRSVPDAPEDAGASRLVVTALDDLGAAEEELRTQNEELFAARTEIEASAAHFRDLFELAPVAYLVTDGDGRVAQVNRAACVLFGRPPNAVVGLPLACFVQSEERSAFDAALLRSAHSVEIEEWPIRLVPKDRRVLECRVQVRALPSSADGSRALAWIVATTGADPLDEM